jgi:hypothetical protein
LFSFVFSFFATFFTLLMELLDLFDSLRFLAIMLSPLPSGDVVSVIAATSLGCRTRCDSNKQKLAAWRGRGARRMKVTTGAGDWELKVAAKTDG